MEKQKLKEISCVVALDALVILITGVVRAVAIFMFNTPNKFAPGGINGVAVLLDYICKNAGLKGSSSGWFMLALNLPLFFVAYFLLGKREAILATASMLVSSGLLILFDLVGFPEFVAPTEAEWVAYGIVASLASGILLGIPLALLLRRCGTAGGTSIIASVINKKWQHLSVSWMTFAFDAVVVISSFFVYFQWGQPFAENFAVNLMPVLLALVSLYVTSKTSDVIIHGFKTAYRFEIITDSPEELAEEIMNKTHHGVTLVHATGMYTHADKSVLVCIIRKRQIAELQRIIRQHPGTFASFIPTSEVYGKFIK